MKLTKQDMLELAQMISTSVVTALKEHHLIGNTPAEPKKEKSAYQKTEILLYNYNNLKKIVEDKYAEIEEIKKHGVPKKGEAVHTYCGSGSVSGLVLPEESVESAVCRIQESVQETVQVISMIDRNMAAMRNDPYYKVLVMRYMEGRTQEDIAVELKCTQPNVAYHKSRLVKELAMRIFPSQVTQEMMH
jgi:DNA-directed RNA polymerase specialized sigma subunit